MKLQRLNCVRVIYVATIILLHFFSQKHSSSQIYMQSMSLYVYLTDIQKHHKAIADNTTICWLPRPTRYECRYYQQARAGCAIPRYPQALYLPDGGTRHVCLYQFIQIAQYSQHIDCILYLNNTVAGCAGLVAWCGWLRSVNIYIYICTNDRVWRVELTSMFCATAHLLLPFYHSIVYCEQSNTLCASNRCALFVMGGCMYVPVSVSCFYLCAIIYCKSFGYEFDIAAGVLLCLRLWHCANHVGVGYRQQAAEFAAPPSEREDVPNIFIFKS